MVKLSVFLLCMRFLPPPFSLKEEEKGKDAHEQTRDESVMCFRLSELYGRGGGLLFSGTCVCVCVLQFDSFSLAFFPLSKRQQPLQKEVL